MSAVTKALHDGIAAAQAHRFDAARPLLQRVTAESPQDPVAWFWLAIASPSADAAIPCLRRVLAIDPSHADAREALAKLLVTQATAVASAGNRSEARVLVTEASQLAPDARPVWLALAHFADDWNERVAALRHAVRLTPDDAQIRTRFRQALLVHSMMLAQTDRAAARALFREAAALDPSDPRVWQALATLADSPGESLQPLRELLRMAPDQRSARIALRNALAGDARSLAAAERVDEACERWREAIALTDDDVELWLELAAITPDQEEAERAVETAYELNPADERTAKAMDRLRQLQIDPRTIEPPADAFVRFESTADVSACLEPLDDQLAQFDASLDAFAQLTVAPPQEPSGAPATNDARPSAPLSPAEPPLAVAVSPPSAAASAPPAPPAESNRSSRRTVMVVDDSPTIRKILALTLERAGYKVMAEPDGESAIERVDQLVPDLILLDIAMPKLDGYEVCKRFKQDPRTAQVPVVMLSGKDAFFDKVKGRMAGATEYLTKPFEAPAVLAVVASYCQLTEEVAVG